MQINKSFLGENCRLYEFGTKIDLALSRRIINLYYNLKQEDPAEWDILDIVPAYTSLAIYLSADSPLNHDIEPLDKLVEKLWTHSNSFQNNHENIHIIEVCYNGEDIRELANYHHLTVSDVIQWHTKPEYFIAMLGFKPYFPYLIGLDEILITPRRDSPRLNVPQGSVAIGGAQTGIYTENSPGGWHIIGYTEFRDFQLFRLGDTILFRESKLC